MLIAEMSQYESSSLGVKSDLDIEKLMLVYNDCTYSDIYCLQTSLLILKFCQP